jgi:hypothetical protein
MDPGGEIYTIDEFRCWKVENLDDERSDENKKLKNEGGGYRGLFVLHGFKLVVDI